jgi:hypothetical protein
LKWLALIIAAVVKPNIWRDHQLMMRKILSGKWENFHFGDTCTRDREGYVMDDAKPQAERHALSEADPCEVNEMSSG